MASHEIDIAYVSTLTWTLFATPTGWPNSSPQYCCGTSTKFDGWLVMMVGDRGRWWGNACPKWMIIAGNWNDVFALACNIDRQTANFEKRMNKNSASFATSLTSMLFSVSFASNDNLLLHNDIIDHQGSIIVSQRTSWRRSLSVPPLSQSPHTAHWITVPRHTRIGLYGHEGNTVIVAAKLFEMENVNRKNDVLCCVQYAWMKMIH